MRRRTFKRVMRILLPATAWQLYAASQSGNRESLSLARYAAMLGIDRSFVEFGFHTYQFNSVDLVRQNYKGLLLDSNAEHCARANRVFRRLRKNVRAEAHWITTDNISPILGFLSENGGTLGALSVDVDGNDYWILKEILKHVRPEIVCVEYNASFGMRRITTPYAADFERHRLHSSGFYHGASITAFAGLLGQDYAILDNIDGLNLIFGRTDRLKSENRTLNVEKAYAEHRKRNLVTATTAAEQWDVIRDMPYVHV